MYTEGSKRYGKPAAVAGENFTASHQPTNLPRHLLWVGKHRARLGPRQQGAIRTVTPVGKGFRRKRMARSDCRLLHRRSGTTHQPQAWSEGADGRNDRDRQGAVRLRLVVEGAVRLDVVQRRAFGTSDRIERSKLRQEQLPDFARGQLLRPPTEAFAVIEPWVGTDGNAISHGYHYGCSHGARVTGVKSAGDVGGAQQWKQCRIGLRVTFADVSVQIELPHPPRFSQAFDRSKDADWSSDESLPASKMLQRSARDPIMLHMAAAVDNDRTVRLCPRRATP